MPLLKDTFFYSLANWSRRLVGFITAPVLIAYLAPEQYGYITFVTTIAYFLSILGLLAIPDQGLPRFFIDADKESDKKEYVSTAYVISTFGITVTLLALMFLSPVTSLIFKDIKNPYLFTGLIALICLSQSIYYVGSNMLKWCFKSFLFTKISVAQAIAGTTITIVGVILFSWKATGVLVVSGVTFFLAGIWANVAVKDYILPVRISKIKLKEMAIYSWPLLGLNIFAYFTRSFDRIFLASLSSLNSVGIFSVSFAVASVFETFVSGFFFAWGPHVIASYRDPSSPRRYAEYFSLFSSLGILSIIVLGLWGGPIVQIIRPDGMYKEIGIYIPWIISGTLIYYLGGYFAPGPNIKKKTYWNLIAFAIAAVINAGLNLMLIPKFGILGAGVATTISSLVAGSFMQIVSNRFYFIPNRWKLSFLIIIATTSIVSAVQNTGFLYNINDHSLPARMMYTIVMTLAIIPFHREIRDGFINIKLKLTSRHESA